MKSENIVKIVEAYVRRNYDGNLLDLFLAPDNYQIASKKHSWRNFFTFLHPLRVNPLRFRAGLTAIQEKNPIYLDNRKLDGFLEHFMRRDCNDQSCEECGYCQNIAEKVLSVPPEYKKRMSQTYQQLMTDVVGGRLFYMKDPQKKTRGS
jgi:hypothetical protein